MKASFQLRLSLVANAIFSLSTSLFMLFAPSTVAQILGVETRILIQAMGIGLLIFALLLFVEATQKRMATWHTLCISIADFFWVISSIAIVAIFPDTFSATGISLVLGVAAVVFTFGAWQCWAISHAHKIPSSQTYRHCIIVQTNVDAEAMWRVVGDMGKIHRYAPSLAYSEMIDDTQPGLNAIRECGDNAGRKWQEQCIAHHAGHSFSMRFMTEQPNFPFPVKTMHGGWQVASSNLGSQITVWWELVPSNKWLAPLILPILAFQADTDFPKIIHKMARAAIASNDAHRRPQHQAVDDVVAQLLPIFC